MPKIRFILDDGSELDQDVPDEVLEMAQSDPNYGKMLRDQVQEAHTLGKRVDRTPKKYEHPMAGADPKTKALYAVPNEEEIQRRNVLGAGGIDVGAGPFNKGEISYFQGLAKDSPHEFAEFFIPRVKEKIAPRENINPRHLVKVGEDGRVRFLNLKTDDNPGGTNRWTEFQGLGFDPFNALELVADVAGSLSGANLAKKKAWGLGKEAFATAGGAALGASEVEAARNLLGKAHGITDPSAGEIVKRSATRGAIAGGGSLVGSGVGAAYHNFKSTPNPYFFNKDTAENFEFAATRGQKVADDIRNMPGGEDFNPDVAQLSGEESLLTLRATLASRGGSTSEMRTSSQLLAKDQGNNRILSNLLQDLTRTERAVTAHEAGVGIKEFNLQEILKMPPSQQKSELLKLYNENLKSQKSLQSVAGVAEEGRQTLINRLRGQPATQVGEKTTTPATGLQRTVEDLKGKEQAAWNEYEKLVGEFEAQHMGGRPLGVNIKGVEPLIQQMERQTGYLWRDASKKKYDTVTEPIRGVLDRGGYVTLHELNVNLSDMKETLRMAQKDIKMDNPAVSAQKAAIAALQKTRDDFLSQNMKAPHIAAALETAEATTRHVHDMTKRSVAKNFLAQDAQGVYKIKNPDTVFSDIMVPGNPEGMRQWMDIIGGDPRMLQATKDWYGQHYHNSVMRNGLADPALHKSWMRDYGAQAEMAFGKDFPDIQRLGRIGFAVKAGEKKLAMLENQLKATTAGRIDRMDPEKIVNAILGAKSGRLKASSQVSNLSLGQVNALTNLLKKNSPETFALLQDRTKEMIRMSMFGDELTASTSTQLSSKKLGKYLEESQAQRLSMVMGQPYVDDLMRVQRGLEVMERSAKGIPMPQDTPALTLFRVIFGPLSKVQRTITAARKYSVLGQEKKLADIISDPAKLRAVMKAANAPVTSPLAISVLTSLGLLEQTQE
jgi:hypothetical protein